MRYLPALATAYIDSAATTTFTAATDTYYVVDTAAAAVTAILPAGVALGHWIVIQNAPANGFQLGGTTAGNNVTVQGSSGETFEGTTTDTISPPTSTVTAAAHKFFPAGGSPSPGWTGGGWAVL